MAVTITYLSPVQSTTAPTALQASNSNKVVADVVATADSDVTATITHNFAFTAAELLTGAPEVLITTTLSQALTALSGWSVTSALTNTVVLTKLASTGSGNAGAQLRVTVNRPHSIVR